MISPTSSELPTASREDSPTFLKLAKRRLRSILAQPFVSRTVTAAVKPAARFIPSRVLLRLPVTRVVEVRSPLCRTAVYLDAAGADPIASMLYWRGLEGWEPETLPIFLKLIKPGSTIVDIGANTGIFSLLAARRCKDVAVHAIEPVPRVFSMLESNVTLNRASNVVCHRFALSDAEGTVNMYVPRDDVPIMASMLPDWRPGSERIEVQARTLDQFMLGLTRGIDVLKIDTEGTEALILSGGIRTLATHEPFVVCEVLTAGQTAKDLTALMTEAQYDIFSLNMGGPRHTDRVTGNEAAGCRNYLFVPHSKSEEAKHLLSL